MYRSVFEDQPVIGYVAQVGGGKKFLRQCNTARKKITTSARERETSVRGEDKALTKWVIVGAVQLTVVVPLLT